MSSVLEPGMVLELADGTFIVRGNSVFVVAMNALQINIGVIEPKEINWFSATSKADTLRAVKFIVYLGEGKFGIKQMVPMMKEFDRLSSDDKKAIIQNYIENYLD